MKQKFLELCVFREWKGRERKKWYDSYKKAIKKRMMKKMWNTTEFFKKELSNLGRGQLTIVDFQLTTMSENINTD